MEEKIQVSDEHLEAAKKYWLDQLSGPLTGLKIPADVPGRNGYRANSAPITFQEQITSHLLRISKNNDLSLFVILLTVLKILLSRILDESDIIVAGPVNGKSGYEYNPKYNKGNSYNSLVIFRDRLHDEMTFRELLMQVSQTVARGYQKQYYTPDKLLPLLELPDNFSLFRVILLLENINDNINWKNIIETTGKDAANDITLVFRRENLQVSGQLIYNSLLFKNDSMQRLINHYRYILEQIPDNVDIKLEDIQLITPEEKQQVLLDFNKPIRSFPGTSTLHGLWADQVKRTPQQTALIFNMDLSHILTSLLAGEFNPHLQKEYERCVFKKNPYMLCIDKYYPETPLTGQEVKKAGPLAYLRTHKGNNAAVNRPLLHWLDYFDGKVNLKSLFKGVKSLENVSSWIFFMGYRDPEPGFTTFPGSGSFEDIMRLIKELFRAHLIVPADYHWQEHKVETGLPLEKEDTGAARFMVNRPGIKAVPVKSKGPVLLLGDTMGTATTGLLYLASFLRRKGIEAFCQWNDANNTKALVKKNIHRLLDEIQPRFVGISLKWFPHIHRVLETAKIIKTHDPSIKVVLGGNTASYYWESLIRCPPVDYVICGDGEIPLLQICRGEPDENIPNCAFKKQDKQGVKKNPLDYVQDETNSSDIFLSHMDEIFVSKEDPFQAPGFYICTGKGCSASCFYCAGCRRVQQQSFNRGKPFLRGVNEVRRDLNETLKYTTTFMFDFDSPLYNSLDYYRAIWQDIDLTHHFGEFYFWGMPELEFVKLVSSTFKYVYIKIDMCSLSEDHRIKLASMGLVKSQPKDLEIHSFLSACEGCANVEVKITLVAGLPYFTPGDIEKSSRMISQLTAQYSCFAGLDWGRLHAQPGAPITYNCENYQMYSRAKTFEDFLAFSKRNWEAQHYPGLDSFHYPYIYWKDDRLNSSTSKHYFETNREIQLANQKKQTRLMIHRPVSYQEINCQTNRIAKGLREIGVKNGDIVVLLLHSPLQQVKGIIGVLKAGAAYLPVDPGYPRERIVFMTKDSGARWILTDSRLESSLRMLLPDVRLSDIHDLEKHPGKINHPVPPMQEQETDPAYVIYTSGTTGNPKGSIIEHRNIVNTLMARKEKYETDSTVIALQLFSYAFDGFLTSCFTPLISGGTVVVPDEQGRKDVLAIKEAIVKNKVTHFISVPLLYQTIIETLSPDETRSLKAVTLAGEAVPSRLLSLTRDKNSQIEIINEYGVTEAAVMSTIFRRQEKEQQVKIGVPVKNTVIYIMDRRGRLQPIGVPGEICISGQGVARGYLNRPELTAEKFTRVVTSSSLTNDHRLYRTGDLGKWLPDGNIVFSGRIDRQVKIRGIRIEPGEIEALLVKHEMVKEAVVLVKEDEKGDKCLYAYFIKKSLINKNEEKARAGKPVNSLPLRDYLSEILPGHMVPSYIIQLERFPITPNGKLDLRALPGPNELESKTSYVPPRDDLERRLARVWQEVLREGETPQVPKIGVIDNFFELGGHSLKAIRLTSRIHKEFQIEISLARVFQAPTIRELAGYIRGALQVPYILIAAAEKREYYPLSSAQKRLYFLQQLQPGNTVYNIPAAFVLEGGLDIQRLEKAFRELIRRHTSLRTSFEMAGNEPVQRIHEKAGFSGQIVTNPDDDGEKGMISKFIRPFDLSRAPLLRAGLIQPSSLHSQERKNGIDSYFTPPGDRFILVVDMHHIVTDGVSMGIIIKDFMQLYEGRELTGLRLQYNDFSQWQTSKKQGEINDRQMKYWQKEFAGEIPALNLPLDFKRPLMQQFAGAGARFFLDREQTGKLRLLASNRETTLFMVMIAMFYILLSRISGNTDIVIGTPIAGRRHEDLWPIVGMFVNSLALRNYPAGGHTFKDFLEQVKQRTLNAFENQDCQFEELVEQLPLARNLSRNPLFDVFFSLQTVEMPVVDMPGLKAAPYEFENRISKFDLSLDGVEAGETLFFTITYCTAIFKKQTIERFIKYFKNIVSCILQDPGREIAGIEILPAGEKHSLLYEFNQPGVTVKNPGVLTVHGDFEAQSVRTPDKVAVTGMLSGLSSMVTYAELNRESGNLAGVLAGNGVIPGDIVAILMERSIEMIMGILAILKAGGAYMPIDLNYPGERLNYMLQDSRARVLLVTPGTQVKVEHKKSQRQYQHQRLSLEILDIETQSGSSHDTSSLPVPFSHRESPGDLAYILYTSGSTGRPRGVMVEHRNISRLVKQPNYIDIDPGDRLLLTGALVFDITTFEIWGSLLNGISLVLPVENILLEAKLLLKSIVKNRITLLHLVPQLLSRIVDQGIEIFAGLRYLLVGGDLVRPGCINKVRSRYNHLKILHMYGPTENTTFTTYFLVDREYENTIPLGRPVNDTTVYIIDSNNRLAPPGTIGELHTGGKGAARGYLNNPELTAEKFNKKLLRKIAGPGGETTRFLEKSPPGRQRLYKTGDLARWLPGGLLEFRGRKDRQVKIRGQRVELKEIEERLLKHNHVKDALVTIKGLTPDDPHQAWLCAYIVPQSFSSPSVTSKDLREYLTGILPGYMIPSSFIFLNQIPLTVNGKPDYRALPGVEATGQEEYTPPGNEIEKKLVEIWTNILPVPQGQGPIGIDHNFFEQGGHSLNAAIVNARIHKVFNVKLELARIFNFPTIRQLSRVIKEAIKEARQEKFLSIKPVEKREYYVLSSAQQRLYTVNRLERASTTFNIPWAVVLEGEADREKLTLIFHRLIQRHESFRTSFHLINGQPVQRVHKEVEFQVNYYNLPGKNASACAGTIKNFIKPFDTGRAPLVRVGLIEEGPINSGYILVVDMHHIIADGVSSGVLIRDFMNFYRGSSPGPLEIQYRDYAVWQHHRSESQVFELQKKYWQERLSGKLPVLAMPADFSRPEVQQYVGRSIAFEIDEELTAGVRGLAEKSSATLYMVLLAMVNIFLARYTGQEDIIIGTPVAGRGHADLEGIIGFFLNVLPMRNHPVPGKTAGQFLEEVRVNTLDAFENQDLPFSALVEDLALTRDSSRNPLYDVVFTVLNIEMPSMQVPGLRIKPYEIEVHSAKTDLRFGAVEKEKTIQFQLTYSTALFKESTAQRMGQRLIQVIQQVVANEHTRIKDISIDHDLAVVKASVSRREQEEFDI